MEFRKGETLGAELQKRQKPLMGFRKGEIFGWSYG